MEKVRWGVISTADIGVAKVIPGMMKSDKLEVLAISSRDQAKADAAAKQLGIKRAYGSYEAMLADPDIEAVYNPLPNHLHVPLTLQALQAGKHVLCEKPFAIKAQDLEVLRPFADKLHIREAFMVKYHPQWHEAREALRAGKIGDVRFIQVAFSYHNTDPANVRNMADIGGGGLYDIGCYAITAGRWFFEGEPSRVVGTFDRDPNFKTDRTASGLMEFKGGKQLAFTVSTQSCLYQRIQILGDKGRLEIEIPFNAPPERNCRYAIDDGSSLSGGGVVWHEVAAADQYQLQAEGFGDAIRNAKPNGQWLDDAFSNMRIIDAFFRSESTGAFEKI